MDKETLAKALQENRLFRIGSSFLFAAQIPDNSVGCSGSRCSHCGKAVAYCNQRCEHCGFPFVGPFGFPQLPEWNALSPERKKRTVEDVYANDSKHGRLGYANVAFMPLVPSDLKEIEKLKWDGAERFRRVHGVSPQEVRNVLYTL